MFVFVLLFCQAVSRKSPVLSSWRHAQLALMRCGERAAPANPALVKSHCLSSSSWAGWSQRRLWLNKAAVKWSVRPVWLNCGSVVLWELGHPTISSGNATPASCCGERHTLSPAQLKETGWKWCPTGWHEESGKVELICKSPGMSLSTCCCCCAFPSLSLSLAKLGLLGKGQQAYLLACIDYPLSVVWCFMGHVWWMELSLRPYSSLSHSKYNSVIWSKWQHLKILQAVENLLCFILQNIQGQP